MAMSKSSDKRPLLAKKNRAKKPRTVFVHAGPSRDDNDNNSSESNSNHKQGKAAQLEALIEHKLASYHLLQVDKNDKKVLLQEDTRKRARPDGKVKHESACCHGGKSSPPIFPFWLAPPVPYLHFDFEFDVKMYILVCRQYMDQQAQHVEAQHAKCPPLPPLQSGLGLFTVG